MPAPEAGGATERGGAQEAGVLNGDDDIISVIRQGCEGNPALFQMLTSILGGNEPNDEVSIGEILRNANRGGGGADGGAGGQAQVPATSGGEEDHGRGILGRLFNVVLDQLTLRGLFRLLMGQYQIVETLHQPLREHLVSELRTEAGAPLSLEQVEAFAKEVVQSMFGSVEDLIESLSACSDAEDLRLTLFELIESQICDVMTIILAEGPPATASGPDSFAMAIREWLGTAVHQIVVEIQGHVADGGFETASNVFVELVQRRLQGLHASNVEMTAVLGDGGSAIGNALVNLMTGVQASLSERARSRSGGGGQGEQGALAHEERASWLETVRRDRERQRGHAAECAAPESEAGAARSDDEDSSMDRTNAKRRHAEGGATQGGGQD